MEQELGEEVSVVKTVTVPKQHNCSKVSMFTQCLYSTLCRSPTSYSGLKILWLRSGEVSYLEIQDNEFNMLRDFKRSGRRRLDMMTEHSVKVKIYSSLRMHVKGTHSGSRDILPAILNLCTRRRRVFNNAKAGLPPRKEHLVHSEEEVVGRSGSFGEEKHLLSLLEIKPRLLQPVP